MNESPHHVFRMHAFVPETDWSLSGDDLIRQGDGAPLRLPLAEVKELRLLFDPTRFVRERYRCDIQFRRGQRVTLINQSYQGIANFEDRSETYGPFVRALIARIAVANPACRFAAGRRPIGFYLLHAFVLAMLFVLMWVLWLTAGLPINWIVPAKLVVIVSLLPTAIAYARKNRPRTFDPTAIPVELLPKIQAAH